MPRNASDPLDLGKSLRRDSIPERDRAARQTKAARKPSEPSALLSDNPHTGVSNQHADMINTANDPRSMQTVSKETKQPPGSAAMERIRQTIREARENAGLNQRQVADALGVTRSAVAQWEGAGGGSRISPHYIPALANLLGLNLFDIVDIEADGGLFVTQPLWLELLRAFSRLPPSKQHQYVALIRRAVSDIQSVHPEGNPGEGCIVRRRVEKKTA